MLPSPVWLKTKVRDFFLGMLTLAVYNELKLLLDNSYNSVAVIQSESAIQTTTRLLLANTLTWLIIIHPYLAKQLTFAFTHNVKHHINKSLLWTGAVTKSIAASFRKWRFHWTRNRWETAGSARWKCGAGFEKETAWIVIYKACPLEEVVGIKGSIT